MGVSRLVTRRRPRSFVFFDEHDDAQINVRERKSAGLVASKYGSALRHGVALKSFASREHCARLFLPEQTNVQSNENNGGKKIAVSVHAETSLLAMVGRSSSSNGFYSNLCLAANNGNVKDYSSGQNVLTIPDVSSSLLIESVAV